MDDPRQFRTTVRLSEPVMRLAENMAAKHGVTVAELVELLLLQCVDHAPPAPAAPPRHRRPARVIDLDAKRRERPA